MRTPRVLVAGLFAAAALLALSPPCARAASRSSRTSPATDMVLSDNDTYQVVEISGDTISGYTATLTVAIR